MLDAFRNMTGGKSKLAYAQMNSNLTDTRALKEQLDEGLRLANDRLCILLGIPVRDLTVEIGNGSVPTPPPQVVVGVPADLLRRRPDVRAAERQVASASAQISSLFVRASWINCHIGSIHRELSIRPDTGPHIGHSFYHLARLLALCRRCSPA